MKKIVLLFVLSISIMISGCYPVYKLPKHDVSMFGSYIKEVGNLYHLFSRGQQCDNPVYPEGTPYIDSLTVDEKIYRGVFFVQVIPDNLHKNAKNLDNLIPCVLRDIMANDSVRKEMPGFGSRKFLVVEKVVGFQ
jgi:hypothetical protein